jgi:GxxExxY protein
MNSDSETYAVIGAAMEVHRELGHGFLEAVYRAALAREFTNRGIPFRAEVELPVFYKGDRLACGYRADFICFEDVLLETKALSSLTSADDAQVLNYLKATRHQRGLLINFGAPSLQTKRLVFSETTNLRKSAQSADQ